MGTKIRIAGYSPTATKRGQDGCGDRSGYHELAAKSGRETSVPAPNTCSYYWSCQDLSGMRATTVFLAVQRVSSTRVCNNAAASGRIFIFLILTRLSRRIAPSDARTHLQNAKSLGQERGEARKNWSRCMQ